MTKTELRARIVSLGGAAASLLDDIDAKLQNKCQAVEYWENAGEAVQGIVDAIDGACETVSPDDT